MRTSSLASSVVIPGAQAEHARFFRVVMLLVAATVAVATLAPPVAAIDLESEYLLESRLLESELDRYVETRERESHAIQEVRRIAGQLDDGEWPATGHLDGCSNRPDAGRTPGWHLDGSSGVL